MATVTKPIALDESFNTTEVTPRNIADVLAEGLSHITGRTASEVEYDNTESELTADNVQDALDEINGKIPTVPSVDIQTAVDEFSTYNGGLLSSLKVSLSPNQDLHGYSEPWVGGAGKNKLPLVLADIKAINTAGTWSGNVYSYNGSTITVNTDESGNVTSIDVTNTPSAAIAFNLFYASGTFPFDINSTYTLNGCPSGGAGTSNYKLDIIYEKNGINNVLATDTGSGASANFNALVGATSMTCRIVIYTNASLPKTFYPMIRLASESDPTFEPYSNICPISGHTQVEVENHQKNLCDDSLIVQGDIDNSTGTDTADGSLKHIRSGYCNAESSTQYTVSHNHTIGSGTLKVFEYRSDKSFIRRTNAGAVTSLSYTFTTHSECKYIRIAIYDESGISKNNTWIQLELGSTATPYVPYNGYQVTVNLGGTYYSGVLDVVSGVLTVDKKSVEYDGSVDENWGLSGFYANTVIILRPADCIGNEDAISEQYKSLSEASDLITEEGLFIGSNINVRDDNNAIDVATWKAYLANNPLKICYKLATPTPIQLSPTMVKALVGENHLSAPLDGQEITESKYKQAFTFDDVIAYIQSLS